MSFAVHMQPEALEIQVQHGAHMMLPPASQSVLCRVKYLPNSIPVDPKTQTHYCVFACLYLTYVLPHSIAAMVAVAPTPAGVPTGHDPLDLIGMQPDLDTSHVLQDVRSSQELQSTQPSQDSSPCKGEMKQL